MNVWFLSTLVIGGTCSFAMTLFAWQGLCFFSILYFILSALRLRRADAAVFPSMIMLSAWAFELSLPATFFMAHGVSGFIRFGLDSSTGLWGKVIKELLLLLLLAGVWIFFPFGSALSSALFSWLFFLAQSLYHASFAGREEALLSQEIKDEEGFERLALKAEMLIDQRASSALTARAMDSR